MKLGETICRLRTEKGMSQGDLADALEVSRQSVSKWETDSSVPELEKLVRLSQLFGVTLDALVSGEQEPRPPIPAQEEPPAAPVKRPVRRTVGLGLLGLGAAGWLLLTVRGEFLTGLTCALPFLITGVLCILVRNAGLWFAWAAFLLADILVQYLDLGWRLVYRMPLGLCGAEHGAADLTVAWMVLGVTAVLVLGTVLQRQREPFSPVRHGLGSLAVGWLLVAVVNIPVPMSGEGRNFTWQVAWQVFMVLEWVRLGLLTAMLSGTAQYIRTKGRKKNAEA